MRINSRKIRKILGRVWIAPKRILKSFCTHEPLDASAWMQHSLNHLFNFRKTNKDFPYTIFPVKKINVWKSFKIMKKLLFNYSLYSHPKIENFWMWRPISLSTTLLPTGPCASTPGTPRSACPAPGYPTAELLRRQPWRTCWAPCRWPHASSSTRPAVRQRAAPTRGNWRVGNRRLKMDKKSCSNNSEKFCNILQNVDKNS
jgi:hypothetical protein